MNQIAAFPSDDARAVAYLAQQVEQRRKELGIKVDEAKPLKQLVSDFAKHVDPISDEEAARIKDADERQRRADYWKSLCGADARAYHGACLSGFVFSDDVGERAEQQQAVEAVAEYIGDICGRLKRGEGVLLLGPCGTGKDHLGMSILREAVLECGAYVKRINGPEWYGRLRDLMGQDSSSECAEIDRLGGAAMLLISDPLPPKGVLTDYQAAMLYRLLERRQANRLATIVTINCENRAEAEMRMGVATVDRMAARTFTIACNWSSFRKPLRKVNL